MVKSSARWQLSSEVQMIFDIQFLQKKKKLKKAKKTKKQIKIWTCIYEHEKNEIVKEKNK